MNKKAAIPVIVVVVIVIVAVAVCVGGIPPAEAPAAGFLESVTGDRYAMVDVTYTKVATGPDTVTGLKAGESRWRVEGTVQHMQTRTRYTVRIFVDELPDDYWRYVRLYMARGVNVPVGDLVQLYP